MSGKKKNDKLFLKEITEEELAVIIESAQAHRNLGLLISARILLEIRELSNLVQQQNDSRDCSNDRSNCS